MPLPTYEDVAAASEWLGRAFGFREVDRYEDESGQLLACHMDVAEEGGRIILGWVGPDYECPRRHRETCDASRTWQDTVAAVDGIAIYIDDVDAHCEQARAAGARILSGPEDTPFGRRYRAEDLEGRRWLFLQG